ncbi:MAG: hypothetical protein KatS3mg105_2657 [Gemmatales bacterium]|nr:MAG: hypothetical protein KatS3mg105_2657 [Gemmatales bacterium]
MIRFRKIPLWGWSAIAGGISIVLCIGVLSLVLSVKKSHRRLDPRMVPLEQHVTAQDLYAAFRNDAKEANARYGNKLLIVTGRIDYIDLSGDYPVYLISGDQFELRKVKCLFKPEDRERVLEFKRGELIHFSGICKGMDVNVNLVDCQLIDVK